VRRLALIALFAFVLAACGSQKEKSAANEERKHPLQEYWAWVDPGIARGNFEAEYADCTHQVETDPAINDATPKLAVLGAYINCMKLKGWKFVDPDKPAAQP